MRAGRWMWIVGVAAVVAACSGDSAPSSTSVPATTATTAPATTSTSSTTSTSTTEPEPEVETAPLEGFEPRSIVFGNVELEVTGVSTTNQDLRTYAEESEPAVGDARFAVLDITATNLTSRTQIGLGYDPFRLRVDGVELVADESMSFLSEVGSELTPGETAESFLAFELDDSADVADAFFVVGGDDDRPEELPLLGDVPEADYPVTVDLESTTAQGVGPTNGGTYVFTALEATLSEDVPHEDANSPSGVRADRGELFLVVHVQAEKVEGRGNDLLSVDAFRLLVDGTPRAPWDVADDPSGSTSTPTGMPAAVVEAWVAFVVPEDLADTELWVGDLDEDPGVIPLDLTG